MERLKILQQIYNRLARLEDEREVSRLTDKPTQEIDSEMAALRAKLQEVMNSPCPVIKDGGTCH